MKSPKEIERLKWFREAALGVFFHWGIYSVYQRAEWAMCQERIPYEEYKKFAAGFKPKKGWADEWMKLVKRSEAKYAVLTTKHCDGYCLFNTGTTANYSAPATGPGRDLIAEYVDACRRHKVKIGFYFTPFDWRFVNWKDKDVLNIRKSNSRKYKEYRKVILTLIEELCTNYGKIDLWWWDGMPPDVRKINARMRRWQPDMVINDRCGMHLDCASSENSLTRPDYPSPAWEVCKTSNKHWGYYADDATCQWMSVAESIHWLVTAAQGGGNLLFNIGPRANGDIPATAAKLFEGIGAWLRKNGASVRGVNPSSITGGCGGAVTARGTTTYLHILHYARPSYTVFSPKAKVKSARVLVTGQRLKVKQVGERVVISDLPSKAPDPIDTVVVLKTDRSSAK